MILFSSYKNNRYPGSGEIAGVAFVYGHRNQDFGRIKTGAIGMAEDRIEVDTGTSELLCEIRDRVALITLNRPEARNALSDRLTPALRRMIKQCGDDPKIGAVLITGAGNAFCAGGDVKGMGSHANKAEMTFEQRVADLRTKQRTLTGALVALRKPTIAALPGPAAGAGLALALACDIRIAAESAIMATGYVRIGLTGDYGVAWLLTRLVGTSRARELMFLSERIDARRCETLGLVNRVVPDAELRETAFLLARSLAEGPSIALAYMKDNLDAAVTADFLQSLDQEAENMVRAARTTDHKEAVHAFIDKRKPTFTGQ
jgi:enoyl-CoA hydratase/carnithine racemase